MEFKAPYRQHQGEMELRGTTQAAPGYIYLSTIGSDQMPLLGRRRERELGTYYMHLL